MPNRLTLALVALLAALAVPSTAHAAKKEQTYYVSLGDSYTVGYQATGPGQGGATRNGFPDQLVRKARARGHRLKLVNFGCGDTVTSTKILQRTSPCVLRAPAARAMAAARRSPPRSASCAATAARSR